ncbi:MAG: AMP phosphorylase [Candidatus Micrarchaeota archaeon]
MASVNAGATPDMQLKAKIFEIEQGQNEVVLNDERARALGLNMSDRVLLKLRGRKAVAIVDTSRDFIREDEIGLFEEVALALGAGRGELISVDPIARPNSLDFIRKKLDGKALSDAEISAVIDDLMHETLSPTELAAFIAGIYCNGMTTEETAGLTNAICNSGEVLSFGDEIVVSSHSIGGVAGDRVSLLIVPIVASLGIKIPKTASRAISSASGTADAMEVLTKVSLSIEKIQAVVRKTNGCLVWGGSVRLASADDKLIRIRNPLRLDPKPLLLSSILAKKKAEGARYVIIDIPVGRGSKIDRLDEGRALAREFEGLGTHLGMKVKCILSDGSSPLTNNIGPALEAKDALETLEERRQNMLMEKSCLMAGIILQMVRGVSREEGYRLAMQQVMSGKALEKLQEIIVEQGGRQIKSSEIKTGRLRAAYKAEVSGKVSHVDNKAISRVCRMLGAPSEKQAGIILKASKGQHIEKGQEIIELVTNSQDKLDYALRQLKTINIFEVENIILDVV